MSGIGGENVSYVPDLGLRWINGTDALVVIQRELFGLLNLDSALGFLFFWWMMTYFTA